MSCITDEAFAAWLSGALAGDEQAAAIDHTAGCAACRAVLGDLFGPLTGIRAPIMVGRYRIEGTIAAGGMGVVLRAIDPALDRPLAIKMAQASQVDAGHRARMLREAQAMARLAHPNVVAVHDYGEIDGEVFVAMALVDGVMLHRWRGDAPRSAGERARVLAEIGDGLGAIHAAGFIHRDIKPENVIVRADGHAVIVDFGLARGSRDDGLGAGSGIAGTPSYLAPEILGGGAATAASDQFAWWRVVEEVMAGAELAPAAQRRLAAAIARGTAPAAAERWADMTAAVAALAGAIAGPRPRTRWPLIAGGAIAVAGAAVIATVLLRSTASEPCVATAPAGWDPAARDRLRPTLVAAGADADRVLAVIDARAEATARFGADACRAAQTRDPNDRARALRREVCLEETWARTRATFPGLAAADREAVRGQLDVLIQVLPVERCAATAMPSVAPPPAGERADAVAAAQRAMSALRRDSRPPPAERLAALDALAGQVAATEYPPALARLHWDRGNTLSALGRHAEAGAELDQALALASGAADDELTARIAIERLRLAFMAGEKDLTAVEAAASTAVEHLDNPAIDAELDVAIAGADMAAGRETAAIERLRHALAIYDRIAIVDHGQTSTALELLSNELQVTGDLAGAQAALDRAVAVARRRYGEDSVETWYVISNRAANRAYLGDVDASAAELAVAVEHVRGADPKDPRVAHILSQYCATQLELTRAGSVAACREAVTATAAAMGDDHPQLIWPLTLLGQGQLQAHDLDGAAETLGHAVAIGERATIGPLDLAFGRAFLAIALHVRDPRRARALAESAIPALLAGGDATLPTRSELAKAFPALAPRLR